MKVFYAEHPKELQLLVPKETVERFLRQKAWKGATDDELKRQWNVLELLLTLAEEWELDTLEYVTVGDYREMFRRFVQGERKHKTEKLVRELTFFSRVLSDFYEFYGKEEAEFLQSRLQEAETSFYAGTRFILPKPQEKEDFYSILEHKENILPEDMDRLNEILDGILVKLGEYFHQGKFFLDFTRALAMYGVQDIDPDQNLKGTEKEEFYFGFWDYFLFDYHLMDSDLTPLAHYYQQEQKKLTFTESSIIRDLLKAKFTIFSIERIEGDMVLCKELFTDEPLELPVPETYIADYHRAIFMGHVHNSGVMLLNYITSIPASPKLRTRIKREVLRQYELFRYQQPEATLEDFFYREAAAVRQAIYILTEYAQLNVLPFQNYPKPVDRYKTELPTWFWETADRLDIMGQGAGMSVYGRFLLRGMYEDYCLLSNDAPEIKQSPCALTAVLYLFYQINGMSEGDARHAVAPFRQPRKGIGQIVDSLQKTLQCRLFDPRYLTEEGFIQLLYVENP